MFGINNSLDQHDETSMAPATVVAQSNMTLPDEGLPSLPDEWHAPSNLNSQALASAIVGPATSAPNPPSVEPIITSSPAPAEIKHQDQGAPALKLDNAYIPIDPGPPVSKSKEPVKPTVASLMKDDSEDELVKMKQKALQSLAPLVNHLEQSPEEKFKTTMMLIQASDNAELVKDAYEAANQIKDEKVRAQALLDVVNEINYFTHHTPVASPS